MSKTLFVQFHVGEWTEEEMEDALESISDSIPEGVEICALPKNIEYMTEDDVEQFMEMLVDSIEGE